MKFTSSASNALNTGIRKAMELGLSYVGTEHILFELLSESESVSRANC